MEVWRSVSLQSWSGFQGLTACAQLCVGIRAASLRLTAAVLLCTGVDLVCGMGWILYVTSTVNPSLDDFSSQDYGAHSSATFPVPIPLPPSLCLVTFCCVHNPSCLEDVLKNTCASLCRPGFFGRSCVEPTCRSSEPCISLALALALCLCCTKISDKNIIWIMS